MDVSDLQGVKTQMRMQKARRTIWLQLYSGIEKFYRNTISRKKAEVATIVFARLIFRIGGSDLSKVTPLPEACGNIQHLAVLRFRYLRRGSLRCRQENVAGTNSQRLSELSFVLLKILLHFRVGHGNPRNDLSFNPPFAA